MKSKWVTLLILIGCLIIVILPPLIHGYIYPTMGDDSAEQLFYIDRMKAGIQQPTLYLGQFATSYLLIWLERFSGIAVDTLFLWFNFVVLGLAWIVIAFVIKNLVGLRVALLFSALTIFATGAVIKLFMAGSIYNLINILIILPIGLYLIYLFIEKKQVYYLISGLLMLAAFYFYHPSGGSLSMVESFRINVPVPETVTNGIPRFGQAHVSKVENIVSLMEYLIRFVGIPILLLVIVSTGMLVMKKIKIPKGIWAILGGLGGLFLFSLVVGFAGWTNYSTRLLLGSAVYLSVIIVILLALVYRTMDKNARMFILVMVFALMIPSMISWFGYNSVVRNPDKEMIAYVNQSSIEDVGVSSQVAPWIYFQFLNKKYNSESNYIIYRDSPMTMRTYNGEWLWTKTETVMDTTNYIYKATDGKVSVYLIER